MLNWSISSTVRNPERIRGFLFVLKKFEGKVWDKTNQALFQIKLFQNKLYKPSTLTKEELDTYNSMKLINFQSAKSIMQAQLYKGGLDLRGRTSYAPIKKLGFSYIDKNNKVRLTPFATEFMKDDYDLEQVFFTALIKWQCPNPMFYEGMKGFNIIPFIATLHLIKKVNILAEKPVGVSKEEFAFFVLTLVNAKNINIQANRIIEYRKQIEKNKLMTLESKLQIIRELLSNKSITIKDLKNLDDYADNTIRYFRLTKYIYIRGNGYYVDIEPRRSIEVSSLLNAYDGETIEFKNADDYLNYLSNPRLPKLPWKTLTNLQAIVVSLKGDIADVFKTIDMKKYFNDSKKLDKDIFTMKENDLEEYIVFLRGLRSKLYSDITHLQSQNKTNIIQYIDDLKNIRNSTNKPSIELEYKITLALNAINDAISIKPNYPMGDDNLPTFTAPAGVPDIECYYDKFKSICEVTMLTGRNQWFNEGQPVMRHLREFEKRINESAYCLFVAPKIHRDTLNTFWSAVRYEYEGNKQKIIPLTISQVIDILEVIIAYKDKNKKFTHIMLKDIYDKLVDVSIIKDSNDWINNIAIKLETWKKRSINAA